MVYSDANDPEPDYRCETIIKFVVIHDGMKSCHVGFLPQHVAGRPQDANWLDGKFTQILELYNADPADHARNIKSLRNHGMASYHLLDDIQYLHWEQILFYKILSAV